MEWIDRGGEGREFGKSWMGRNEKGKVIVFCKCFLLGILVVVSEFEMRRVILY